MQIMLEAERREHTDQPAPTAGAAPFIVRQLQQRAARNPGDPVVHWMLGQALAKAGDREGAERAYLSSLSLKESGAARQGLAELYLRQGRAERAEIVHLEGLRLAPRDPRKLAAYAAFLAAIGRGGEAERFHSASRRWR